MATPSISQILITYRVRVRSAPRGGVVCSNRIGKLFTFSALYPGWDSNVLGLSLLLHPQKQYPIGLDAAAIPGFLNPAFGDKTTSKVVSVLIDYAFIFTSLPMRVAESDANRLLRTAYHC